jgi:phosphoglycolate phosphatase-like HAD superfamily hydrolase
LQYSAAIYFAGYDRFIPEKGPSVNNKRGIMNEGIFLAFDIDGTIYDAGEILEEAFRLAVESFIEAGCGDSLHVPTREEITVTLGYPLGEIFMMLFPALEIHKQNELAVLCTVNLVNMIREKRGSLIDGVEETIKSLSAQGYKMLVASNGARAYVEAILETYDFKKLFSEPFIYPEGGVKNKTDIISNYIRLNPEREIIMIGDRFTDLAAARDNGIPFIGCAFGHAGVEEIEGEKYIVHDFREIPVMLEKIKENKLSI